MLQVGIRIHYMRIHLIETLETFYNSWTKHGMWYTVQLSLYMYQSASLAKSQNAGKVHGYKPWVTN